MKDYNKDIITNILYRTTMNTGLSFSYEEYICMLNFIKDNPEFCSKWISNPKIRSYLKLKDKLILLDNFNIDILINSQYFTYCSKTELMKVLQTVDRKSALKEIINQTRQTQLNLNHLTNKDKKEYIESLIMAKKLSQ